MSSDFSLPQEELSDTTPAAGTIFAALQSKKTRLRIVSVLLFGSLFLPLFADAGEQRMAKPNVLLIVSEDNGPELGCYGDPYVRTPALDALAAGGVRFDRAYVPYSVCSPSRAAFLTGRYPSQNGQIGLATHKFEMYEKFASIPSLLKQAGYTTGLIGKLHVNPESAFPFDFRSIRGANFGAGQRDMKKYAAAAATFFASAEEKPFFLSINYPDAHFPLHRQDHGLPEKPLTGKDVKPLPWVGADSPRLREFTADYYNCIARLDAGVAMLLEALLKSGKADNTLIIYIGDHGAQFSRGKCGVYESSLRVPMIVSWPGHTKAGTVSRPLVSTVDILPTILKAAGLDIPEALPGIALQDLLAGRQDGGHTYIYGMTTGAAPGIHHIQFSIRGQRRRLVYTPFHGRENRFAKAYLTQFNAHFAAGTRVAEIAAAPPVVQAAYKDFLNPPEYELYDLKHDPYELNNLADDPAHQDEKLRLIAALKEFQSQHNDPMGDPALLKAFDDGQMAIEGAPYRKQKDFHWPYVEKFRTWIKKRETE